MRFEAFSFGSICIDGTTYGYDLVIDRGRIRKRKKKPSKRFRDRFGHTPLSIEEEIPWKCRRLVIDRKSTRLNSSHTVISYAVFCLKKKKKQRKDHLDIAPGLKFRAATDTPLVSVGDTQAEEQAAPEVARLPFMHQ